MSSAGTVVDKTGGKKPHAPPPRANRSENSSGGKNNKGERKQNKKRTAAEMEVEDQDLVEVVDATMGGQTQPTQDDAEMATSTQGSTSTAATEQLPQMGEELKWNVLLNVAEKVKLGLEKNVFSPDKVEDIIECMIKNTTGKQQRFQVTDRERSCMITSAIMIVMTLEMEEHSRSTLKVEDMDRCDEKNSAAALEGVVSEFRFVVHQRMQGNAMWRAAIHEHCKSKWLDDRRNVLEASNPDFEVELDVIDIGTEFFREARRNRPIEDKGLFDSELHDHVRKYADKIIDECKDTEVLTDLHWKPVAKRLLQYLLASGDTIVDARICFGSLIADDFKKIDLKSPELKNRTDALDKVPKKEAKLIFNFLMIGELELGFAESSWRRVTHDTSEDDIRSGAPVRGKEKVDDETAIAVAEGFWDEGNKKCEKSTALAIRGPKANTGVGTTAIVPHGKRGKANVIADLERWHKMSAIEKLQACRDTPLDEILLPDVKTGFFVLMKDYFLLEVEEVAKSVIIFKMYEVLDLNDSLALRVRSQRDGRITGLIRRIPFELEKGDFVAALVDWQNHYKTGKAELRITGEDHMYVVREPWNFLVHSETKGLPPRIADVEPAQTGTELVKFDEKSIFAKVQGMIDENSRHLRTEIDEGNKKNIEKMENMLTSSITPLQEKMATVVKSSEDTKDELQGIRQRMKKEEKKRKTREKRSDNMLKMLLRAQNLEVPEADESDSSESSEDPGEDAKKGKTTEPAPEKRLALEDEKKAQHRTNPPTCRREEEKQYTYDDEGIIVEKKAYEEKKRIIGPGPSPDCSAAGTDGLDGAESEEEIEENDDAGLAGDGAIGAVGPAGADGDGKVKDEVARIEEQVTLKRMSTGPSDRIVPAGPRVVEPPAAGPLGGNVGAAKVNVGAGGQIEGANGDAAGEKNKACCNPGEGEVDTSEKTVNEPETKKHFPCPSQTKAAAPAAQGGPTQIGGGGAPVESNVIASSYSGSSLLATKPQGHKPVPGGGNKHKAGKNAQARGTWGAAAASYQPVYQHQRGNGNGNNYNQHYVHGQPYAQQQQNQVVNKNNLPSSPPSSTFAHLISLIPADEEASAQVSALVSSHFRAEQRRCENDYRAAATEAIENHLLVRRVAARNGATAEFCVENLICEGTNLTKHNRHSRLADTTDSTTRGNGEDDSDDEKDDLFCFESGNQAVDRPEDERCGGMRRVTIVTQSTDTRRNRGRHGRRRKKELEVRCKKLYDDLRVAGQNTEKHVVSKLFDEKNDDEDLKKDYVTEASVSDASFGKEEEIDNELMLFAAAAVYGGKWRRRHLGSCFVKFVPNAVHKSINKKLSSCVNACCAAAGIDVKSANPTEIGFFGGVVYTVPTPKTITIDHDEDGTDAGTFGAVTAGADVEENADCSGESEGEHAHADAADGADQLHDSQEVVKAGDDGHSTEASDGEGGWETGDDDETDDDEQERRESQCGAIQCGAVPSKAQDGPPAPERNVQENKKKKKIPDEEDDKDDDEAAAEEPAKKRRRGENPFVQVPIDEVEPLPGRRQFRVTNVNMMGTEVHSERLSWIADVAGWRKIDVALLSEFAYLKKRCKAAAKKRFSRRLRKSGCDEESSDDEANDEWGAVVYDDPTASKGAPTWVLRTRFDLLYINGCGIMLFNKKLREQAKRIRQQQQSNAIRSQTRFLALYLSEVVLAATYAPTANASEIELETYDSTVVSMLQEMRKRRRDKWKLRVVGGDVSAHVGRDEFGDSVVHLGVGGARATNARGKEFAKALMATNTVLVSSKFAIEEAGDADELYHTYKGKAGIGRSEVDHFLAYGPHLSKFRSYRRVDYGAPDENGIDQARVGCFDHLSVEVLVDVKTRRRLEQEGEERAIAAREILEEVDPELLQKFNDDLKRRVRVAGENFHLEDFQDFLVDWLDDLSGKRSQQPPPDDVDPDELADSGRARANMWKLFRDQKLNERPSSGGKGGITPQQAKRKYDEVGNSPLFPGEAELPVSKEVQDLAQAFPPEMMEKLEKPVSAAELKRAAQHLKQGGKAKDINGLGADILLKLDAQSLELMTGVVQRELKTRDFHLLGGGLHCCRDVSLFKGKGERSDPDSYRFLVISPLITKLLVRVMSERLYDALEAVNFFHDTQFGFRRKRGTQDSMLVMNRLREDLRNYRFGSALRMMVILVDLRKAFPSLDWRLVTEVVKSLGVHKTKMWEVLDATHRSATHSFGEGSFDLEHGCKEGDPSSPLLFIMAFTVVMKRLKLKLEERRIARGEARPEGVPLFAREEVWHLAREDKLVQLGMGSKPGRAVDYVLDFLFADGTTLVQRIRAEQVRKVKEHDEEAKRNETRLLDLPAMEVFGQTLTDCGLRENESKRVQADVVEIITRNLGMSTDPAADCAEKIKKAWKAYWTLRSRLAGVGGIGNSRRGELLQAMVRSILLYGLNTRYVSPAEATKLQVEENKILGQVLDCRWWEREMRGWTYADLRRRSKVPAFKIHLKFLQARHFAHVMRMQRDRITWKAMVGKFVPPMLYPRGAGEFDLAIDWLRSDANVAELEPAAREMPDMLKDRIAHLTEDCGLPIEMLRLLFETLDEANARRPELKPGELYATNKRVFYAATRKWLVRETARDWAKGDLQVEERAADTLIEKYFGDRTNPNETREQMRKRAVAMAADITPDEAVRRHYRPSASGIENVFYSGCCKWCGVKYGPQEQDEIWCEPTEIATVPQLLREHLSTCHPVYKPDEDEIRCRQEFVKLAKARDTERGKQIRSQIIGQYACLSEVRKTGPRRAGRVTHVPKIACRYCKHKGGASVHFTSRAGAMALHAKAHLRDDYIKISQMYKRVRADDGSWKKVMINEYRPEYHQLHPNGHHFAGSDASLCKIVLPRFFDPRFVDSGGKPSIRCRFCKKFHVEYDEKLHDLSRRGKAVSWMRKHEAICSSRPKVVKVPWKVCKKATAKNKKKVLKKE